MNISSEEWRLDTNLTLQQDRESPNIPMKCGAIKQVKRKFIELEKKLERRFPSAILDARKLAANVVDPRTATPADVWRVIWSKPLFANTKVKIGSASEKKLRRHMRGAWRYWGVPGGKCCICKIGLGVTTKSFEARTPLARNIRVETGIAMHRLFAIQGAATALRKRVAQVHLKKYPYNDLFGADVSVIIHKLRTEMGPGWGHITVLHMLTDLGLACKPDLHLVRAVRYLGMSMDIDDRKVPNLVEAIKINDRVSALVLALYGKVTPEKFRYVDKILMEISRRGIIPGADKIIREKIKCFRRS